MTHMTKNDADSDDAHREYSRSTHTPKVWVESPGGGKSVGESPRLARALRSDVKSYRVPKFQRSKIPELFQYKINQFPVLFTSWDCYTALVRIVHSQNIQ